MNQMRMRCAAEQAFSLLHNWNWGHRMPTRTTDGDWIRLTTVLFDLGTKPCAHVTGTAKRRARKKVKGAGATPPSVASSAARRCKEYIREIERHGWPAKGELEALRRARKGKLDTVIAWRPRITAIKK